MADEEPTGVQSDELDDSDGFPELARFQRGDELRIYKLRPIENGAELWRFTEASGALSDSVKETTFRDAGEALLFLEDLNRALKAGGWVAV